MTHWLNTGWFKRWRQPKRNSATSHEVLSAAEGYRRWASSYGREPNAFQQLEAPVLAKLLPDVTGRRVLDLGCGKGRISQLAMEQGAAQAIASDLSLAMLVDRECYEGPKLISTASKSLPFRRHSFDLVVGALVLGHVEHLDRALAAIGNALRPGGALVVSDFHPFATLRGWQRTFKDSESGETHTITQHLHLFSDYVRELGRQGLIIEAMEEVLWEGSPVLFCLRAHKSKRSSSSEPQL